MLDDFTNELQCEDIASEDNENREDLYARDFINSQEEQDEFNEMEKERRKESFYAQDAPDPDEKDWRKYV